MVGRIGALLFALILPSLSVGETAPTGPIVRIETGRHTALIHAVALDETTGRAYSASDDKTVRVWRIADGKPLDTFRVPIGLRADGQLYALALSPNGKTLAVGGRTCWDREGSGCVYLLDAATGVIASRIAGLPNVVAALRIAPDGRHLAIGLMGGAGVRVYSLAGGVLVAEDAEYRDKVLELDFTAEGRLVATSLDGLVRIYDEHFVRKGRIDAGLAGRQPFGIRCSPDGRLVAVGFSDVAKVSLLRIADLTVVTTFTAPKDNGPRNLTRLAWAPDSSMLYATGEKVREPKKSLPGGAGILFRWRIADPAHVEAIEATGGQIGDMAVTRDGSVVFGSDEPVVGVLDPRGRVRYRIGSGLPDFSGAPSNLRVSRDGTELEIALGRTAAVLRRFSVTRAVLERPDRLSKVRLSSPTTTAVGWSVKGLNDLAGPTINGRPPPLERYDTMTAYAFSPDGESLLLGSEWALRLIDRQGRLLWPTLIRMPTAVRGVTVSGDGRFAIAALADGTVSWYAMQNGSPVLSLFIHADGETWVAWTPGGEYVSSAYGDNFVGWHVNRGAVTSPDFYRAVQFERVFYRPDLLRELLTATLPSAAAVTLSRLDEIAPPRIRVRRVSAQTEDSRDFVQLEFSIEPARLPVTEYGIYVNGIPVLRPAERVLSTADARGFVRQVRLPASSPGNQIRIEALNGISLGLAETYVDVPRSIEQHAPEGDLYVLSMGANRFPDLPDDSWLLDFAAQDAVGIAESLWRNGAGMFSQVHTKVLADSEELLATKQNILDSMSWLESAGANDTVIVFLASHGMSDKVGNYYFIPRDATASDVAILKASTTATQGFDSLIGWQDLFNALRKVAGRRVLVLDTCTAKNAVGTFDAYSLKKRSASSSFALMVAAQGTEYSQEYEVGEHGLFTYGLLRALEGGADQNRDRVITLTEAFDYLRRQVEALRYPLYPQTPALMAPWPLAETGLAVARAKSSAAKTP